MVFPESLGRRFIPVSLTPFSSDWSLTLLKYQDRTNGGRKRCLYFDPDGACATSISVSVTNSLSSSDQFAMLELLDPFVGGRELVRGCRVRVVWHQQRHYFMVYTKYRRSQENISVRDESGGQESWKGPVVVMRMDTRSATRLVSITSRIHRELAIRAVARYTKFSTFVCFYWLTHPGRYAEYMNQRISSAFTQRKRISWPRYL